MRSALKRCAGILASNLSVFTFAEALGLVLKGFASTTLILLASRVSYMFSHRLPVDSITTLSSLVRVDTSLKMPLLLFSKKNSLSTAPFWFMSAALHLALPTSIPTYLIISFHSPSLAFGLHSLIRALSGPVI